MKGNLVPSKLVVWVPIKLNQVMLQVLKEEMVASGSIHMLTFSSTSKSPPGLIGNRTRNRAM
jgi:hypothetical protein